MAYADCYTIPAVSTLEYLVEDILLFVFEISSQTIRAKVSDLHHACELAVHEERRFNYAFNSRPKRSRP
jgi:hypothetical protein